MSYRPNTEFDLHLGVYLPVRLSHSSPINPNTMLAHLREH